MSEQIETRIVRCWHCRGMMKVPGRALSVFCPHCQKRASLEDLVIVGSHPGKALITCGDVCIESTARLHLEVMAHRIILRGRLKGRITASDSVEVESTGHVIGDISAPRIVVHEGGVIEGRCEMTRPIAPPLEPVVQSVEQDHQELGRAVQRISPRALPPARGMG